MSLALITMSHSPLLHHNEQQPPEEVQAALDAALDQARAFVADVDPQLVVSFAPDHYNGFFYDLMPAFCIGYQGVSVGDYDCQAGELDVPTQLAEQLAEHVATHDVDVAISRRMELDHGAVQPLELLFGDIAAKPVLPVFVNGVAKPFVRMSRVRRLGAAIGSWLAGRDERVLLIGSGGLSHDPPVPQWATATEQQRTMLLAGRQPTEEARRARQQRVIDAAVAFANGEATIMDLAPEWDAEFMRVCAAGDPTAFDAYTADEMARVAGNSAHEVRTWVAAFSALAAAGPYTVESQFYRPIPEYIAGFGIMTARQR